MKLFVLFFAVFGLSSAQFITRGSPGVQLKKQNFINAPQTYYNPGHYGVEAGSARYINAFPRYQGVQSVYDNSVHQGYYDHSQYSPVQRYNIPVQSYNTPVQRYSVPSYNTPVQYSSPVQKYSLPVNFERSQILPGSPVHVNPVYHAGAKAISSPAIIKQVQDVNFDGSFTYGFESEDGILVQSTGSVKSIGPEETAQTAQGSYSYTAPDGTPITTNWYADETGFHVQGAHLPKAYTETAIAH